MGEKSVLRIKAGPKRLRSAVTVWRGEGERKGREKGQGGGCTWGKESERFSEKRLFNGVQGKDERDKTFLS